MNNIQVKEVKNELHRILSGMDIPEDKFDDLHWLSRNIEMNNNNHPNIILASWLIRKLRVSENEKL